MWSDRTMHHLLYKYLSSRIETCTHNHSHGETLNVLTSAGSERGCSGYEVVPTNVIRTALILEFHTQPCILHGQIICSSHS